MATMRSFGFGNDDWWTIDNKEVVRAGCEVSWTCHDLQLETGRTKVDNGAFGTVGLITQVKDYSTNRPSLLL
jgi:hypothetical protein